jgi:eukaryotic-like serine/threonine-protein kinase
MMDAATERVEEIFYAALEVKALDERKAFLDRACAGDSQVRSAVEEMLLSQTDVEEFFRDGSPALAGASEISQAIADSPGFCKSAGPVLSNDEELGKRIGPYKLLQKIGEGGCGSVYMAEQETPVRRRVALKVIKLGMDTKSVIARFEAERQALAMMDHPNIARVLDAGATETGRPYFVMELVRGVKITAYCDENCLDARERLDLFIQVCHAIQHAHQKGIIHRDIKPSNILITMHDGLPVPKVIDFGIAKATSGQVLTDKTLFTAYDQFVGTPAYMSPEQAEMSELDVDTRSDIYSLGVLLYELLTGKTPFDQKELLQSGLDEMRRTLREREPHRPSTKLDGMRAEELTQTAMHRRIEPRRLKPLLSGDLDWIVMKALEKDRDRRYETANGLAADVQRYLSNEPVAARPPSRFYRFQKLVRRNKGTFAAAAAVSAALIFGLGVSTALLFKEREARREADRLRQQAEARAKLSQAITYLSWGKNEKADALVGEIAVDERKLEYPTLFRALGDWHGSYGRWREAADRFAVLMQVVQPDDWDTTTLDYLRYGPVLVEAGDLAGYERFREAAIAHYTSTTNPIAAERVVKMSLLRPADARLLDLLQPLGEVASVSLEGDGVKNAGVSMAAWRAFSLALWELRRGNCEKALVWCQRSVGYQDSNPSRAVNVRLVAAMARRALGQTSQTRSEVDACRMLIENQFTSGLQVGDGGQGFWFDWVFARILLDEAAKLIEDRR